MAPVFDEDGRGRPLSVKEISNRAQAFDWNGNIPFKHWLRTAQTLQQEADMYLRDGNITQAYLLYLRYSMLVLDLLNTHPEAKTPDGRKALRNKAPTVEVVLKNMERLKPIIEQDYQDWTEAQAKKKILAQKHRRAPSDKSEQTVYQQHASKDPALAYASRLLDAGEHQDLAVELAQKEIRRRDKNRKIGKGEGDTQNDPQDRRTAGFWENWTKEIAEKQAEDEEAFRRQMESTRRRLDGDTVQNTIQSGLTAHNLPTSRFPEPPNSVSNYSYPKVLKSTPVDYNPQPHKTSDINTLRPDRPLKQAIDKYPSIAPERPMKTPHLTEDNSRPYAIVDRSQDVPGVPPKIREKETEAKTKQHGVAFKPAAYLENGDPIRPIFLPRRLRDEFLNLAADNTRRGLEMCGILCGTAVNNALFVRCLLIPEQKCTSDTCETENEGTMLEYCIEADLLMLGWIHTHPTQTCFMSSRDLHTQAGYQVMFPESIAIVCAPKFEPSYGIFRLTNPPGLPHILGCTQSSTFHAHSADNLYTGAEHPPGHVYEHDGLDFYVHDLRPGFSNTTGANKRF
ncbi:hypothetical protein GGS20DRAFT_483183 [Poronia punctata]|nr:hypothetical protein GGS20DRAFT_483183 [Poronia punctata]